MSWAREPQGSQERWLNQNLFVYNAALGLQGTGAGEGLLVPWVPCQRGREGQALMPEPHLKECRSFCKHLGRGRGMSWLSSS